jgi:hypothetical protein
MCWFISALIACASFVTSEARGATNTRVLKLVPNHISLANGKSFDLNLPEGFWD